MAGNGGREAEIALLPGFTWALPEAFAPAVSGYRFEQGDVLYRDRRGHEALVGDVPDGLTAIQLRQPPRSTRAVPGENEGDRRLANWQSEVELDLVDLATGRVETRTTTQGRLFTALWKGDEGALRGEGCDPELPRSARDLAQALREGELGAMERPEAEDGSRFCFVVDLANDASRAKAALIADALSTLAPLERSDRDPIAAGARDGERYHPTLVVRELVARRVSIEAVETAL
ncbi:hypothetical protein K2X89_05300, partial [Myxococcota bacterium]|nr:hypothetical protein [Myxococcota bacterium]